MDSFTLRRYEKIRKSPEYQIVYKLGRRFHSRHFLVIANKNRLTVTRIGLSVSKRTGCAVYRNYIKRRIREAFRLNKRLFANNALDIVVIAKRSNVRPGSHEIFHELQKIFKIIASNSY